MSHRSQVDSERFGRAIGRARLTATDQFLALLDSWRVEALEMVIIRVNATDIEVSQLVEGAGARLCDTLVDYAGEPGRMKSAGIDPRVRSATGGDADAVAAVAAAGFRDYIGHYHADPRLAARAADEAYADWAWRSVAVPGVADRVWIAEEDGATVGFLTLKVRDQSETEILLNAVDPAFQGRGIYRALLDAAIDSSRDLGAKRIRVSTQLANYRVQQIWVRSGFELTSALHTFHLWLDEVRPLRR